MIEIMSTELIERILTLTGKRRRLVRDRYLFHQGDPAKSVYVVEDGLIELARYQLDGSPIVLQRAVRRTVLAEASVYSEAYHCDAIVRSPSVLFEVPKKRFLDQLRKDEEFSDIWASHLAKEVQSARYRSEILSRRTVAERLNGWLAWKGGGRPEKGKRKAIAEQIGVSPEALYRELAKRRFK